MSENIKENDLFFVCGLIEFIARKTKNKKSYIVDKMGKDGIKKIYDLAEVYHCENIEKVTYEIVIEYKIEIGDYDIVEKCEGNIPSYFDIGRVYQRLILMLSENEKEFIDKTIEVLSSWIIEKIDNYNSSMYYENPSYIYACYKEGKIL